jgi:PAS domain S-box-containing protein
MSQIERTVLIVDDSLEDTEMYRRYLLRDCEYKYTIETAKLGQEGLMLWQQQQPDVVLLDYRLPDLDGLEFLVALQNKAQQLTLPVIMVTGQGNEAIAAQAIKAGAQDYLVKGQITQESLKLTVNGTIEAVQLRNQLQQHIEQKQVIAQIAQKVHQSLNLDEILQIAIEEVRKFLKTDRVIVFRLEPDGSGNVMAESVGAGWMSILSTKIYDPCFAESYVDHYRHGMVTAKANICDGSIDPCHVELLTLYQVKANLVVPILHEEQFWGVLIAHHCSAPRQWQALEIDLLQQLSTQVSVAIRQAELYQQAQHELAERKRTEEVLRGSEERLRLALQAARMGTWDWNIQENQITWSSSMEALFRLPSGEFDGSYDQFVARLHPEDRERVLEAINTAFTTGANYDIEFRVMHSKGRVRWALSQGKVFYDATGQPIRMLGVDLDITERKQAEIEREQIFQLKQAALAESERANRIKDEFLAVLSHELRSPLNPILGWTKILQSRKLDATQITQALATIERNAKLQTKLIDDLLDIARVLRGKLSLNVLPVNLLYIIESALDTVQTAATAKSIQIHPLLSEVGQVSGDNIRLQQIVWNLLSNAVKFTPNGGRVEIRLEQVDNQAQIMVTDTGKGINPAFMPHIFESFRQEDASVTREHGGLGLGLAIVYQLVEAHGGTITADSLGEGKGATFTVRLPLLNIKSKENQSDELLEQELDLRGIRVLTIDDEADSRELLTVLLAQAGAEVMTVASAAEFMAALESFQPDVLVSDIGMPEIDGYALLRLVRSLSPERGGQVPALALTAYAGEMNQKEALAAGFQKHISKPVEPNQLVARIADLLGIQNKLS